MFVHVGHVVGRTGTGADFLRVSVSPAISHSTNCSALSCIIIIIRTGTNKKTKTNSVVLVRKRTILTERPPFVGEVSANFSG
jgi:hypothetical protein